MIFLRNNDVKKHLVRAVPRFVPPPTVIDLVLHGKDVVVPPMQIVTDVPSAIPEGPPEAEAL
jgi:hypothetical protein